MSDEWLSFIRDLQALEKRAADQSLWVTMRVINAAVRAADWEKSGDRETALRRAQDRLSQDASAPP